MTSPPERTWHLVETAAELEGAAAALLGMPRLYLDTEFESGRSGCRICLLQLTAGEGTFLVDVLKLKSLAPLREVLAAPDTEWVLHAGLQDVQLLMDHLELPRPHNLFDTQVAWGLLSAESSVSLAYLLFRLLGQRSNKAHQADDWMRRPLPESQLAYAAADVRYLPELRDCLGALARERNRERIVCAASVELLQPMREASSALTLDSFRNAWQLEPPQQAALRYLIDWFNHLPIAARPVLEVKTLLAIASRLPESLDALGRIKGVSRSFVQRAGQNFVVGLRRAATQARADEFVPIDPPPYATFEDIRLDAWLGWARAEICAELKAAPDLVLPARLLKSMRQVCLAEQQGPAALGVISGWRRELIEEAFLAFCQAQPPPL